MYVHHLILKNQVWFMCILTMFFHYLLVIEMDAL